VSNATNVDLSFKVSQQILWNHERSTWREAGFTVAREILMIKCLLRNIRHRNTCSFNSGNCITRVNSVSLVTECSLTFWKKQLFTKGLDLSQRFVIDQSCKTLNGEDSQHTGSFTKQKLALLYVNVT